MMDTEAPKHVLSDLGNQVRRIRCLLARARATVGDSRARAGLIKQMGQADWAKHD